MNSLGYFIAWTEIKSCLFKFLKICWKRLCLLTNFIANIFRLQNKWRLLCVQVTWLVEELVYYVVPMPQYLNPKLISIKSIPFCAGRSKRKASIALPKHHNEIFLEACSYFLLQTAKTIIPHHWFDLSAAKVSSYFFLILSSKNDISCLFFSDRFPLYAQHCFGVSFEPKYAKTILIRYP